MINISVSVSESVIFIADILVIGISVYLLIGAPLKHFKKVFGNSPFMKIYFKNSP